jgi:hypothetical protein
MTKYILTLLLSTIISFTTNFAQFKKDTATKQQPKAGITINIDTLKTRTIIDTLKVQVVPTKMETNSNDRPWQVTLIVGLLVFVATIIASLINRRITLRGINTNKDIAITQIENSQLVTQHQFNATLKTKNRQDWVNEVRNSLVEFIANCVKINIEFQDPGNDSKQKVKDMHEKITFHRTKLRLLLSSKPEKLPHSNLLASIKTLVDILDVHVLNYKGNVNDWKNGEFQKASDKIVDDGRVLLYDEWKEIQKLTTDSGAKK